MISQILRVLILVTVSARCQENFQYKTILDHANKVQLRWTAQKNEAIEFELRVLEQPLPVIVGFGFSDHGEFENADFGVFEINKKGNVIVYDANTDSEGVLQVIEPSLILNKSFVDG